MFSRRRMLLGCITLGAALALCVGIQALFGWGRAQLDTGTALSADTLRLHIRAASDTIADQTDKLAVRDALLAYLDAHCTASTQPEARAWAARTPARLAACRRRGAGAAGQFCTGAGAVGGNVLRYHPVSHRPSARRAVSGCADRPWRGTLRPELVVRALPRPVPLRLRRLRRPRRKRPRLRAVRPAVQVRGNMAKMDRQPPGQDPHRQPLSHVPSLRCIS